MNISVRKSSTEYEPEEGHESLESDGYTRGREALGKTLVAKEGATHIVPTIVC
jgi:hypothetical protein